MLRSRLETLFSLARLKVLFDAPGTTTDFDVTADGRKFLVPLPDEHTSNQPVHVVLNWAATFKR